jgi:ABC-2 type transport system ATP-binding protein
MLSTHVLQEVQAVCDRVLILNRGQLVADAPTQRIQELHAGGVVAHAVFGPGSVRLPPDVLRARIEGVPGVTRTEPHAAPQDLAAADVVAFEVHADRDVRADLFDLAVREGLRLHALGRETTSLEEVFRRLTG